MDYSRLCGVTDSSLLHGLQRRNLREAEEGETFALAQQVSSRLTHLGAVQEAHRVAGRHSGSYPGQVLLGRVELRLHRRQQGQSEQRRGRPVRAALQLALVHQGVTEGHDLAGNTQRSSGRRRSS